PLSPDGARGEEKGQTSEAIDNMAETHTHTHDSSGPEPMRRRMLQWWAVGMGAVASAVMGLPLVGYFLNIVLKPEPDEWIDLGAVSEYPERQTRLRDFVLPWAKKQEWNGPTKKASAYVRRLDGNSFEIFAVNCAHLGCPVAWFPQAGLFMCPCHGG